MSWFEVALHTMGSGTLTKVDGTINAAKYVEILNSCLWPGIVGHFTDDNYCFQDDNAPVHRARVTKTFMDENEIKTMAWSGLGHHWKCMIENENWVAENVWYSRF